MTSLQDNNYPPELFKDKILLSINCVCHQKGYISVLINSNYQTVCPNCRIKHFSVTCDKCKTGYIFPETEKKEINLVEGWWQCSMCNEKSHFDLKNLPDANWLDKSKIPPNILKEKTKELQVYPIMKVGFILILLVMLISPIMKILKDKPSPEKDTNTPTVVSLPNNWKSDFIDGVSFQYPGDFTLVTRENGIFEAKNERISMKIENKNTDGNILNEIESIKINTEKNPEDSTVKIIKLSRHIAYINTIMSAEGIFFNSCYIPVSDNAYVSLIISTDTRDALNKKPEIYTETGNLTNDILKTFNFTSSY